MDYALLYLLSATIVVGMGTTTAPALAPSAPKHVACTCGVFLSGSFNPGTNEEPRGAPAMLHEQTEVFPDTPVGAKHCTNRCLDVVVRHLPNSPAILCAAMDRDCHKERAYLFIKNGVDRWVNTHLSAGREYCCKAGRPYQCPLMSQ